MIQGRMLRQQKRVIWLLVGLLWFIWLGYEDRGLNFVMLLGGSLAGASSLTAFTRWLGGKSLKWTEWLFWTTVVGMLGGAAVTPLSAFLVIIKIGLHSHPTPDFNPLDIAAIFERTPIWLGIGLLIGFASGLVGVAIELE